MSSRAPFHSVLRCAAVVLVGLVSTAPAVGATTLHTPSGSSQKLSTLEAQRNAVRAQKAKSASKVNALKASDSQIKSTLNDLSANVSDTSQRLQDAQAAVSQAESDQATAQAQIASAKSKLGALRKRIRTQAVEAYVSGQAQDGWSIFTPGSADDAINRETILDFQSAHSLDSLEDYRSIQEDLDSAKQRADSAAQRAHDHRDAVSQRLAQLQAAQAQQQKFADQVDQRIDSELAEADSLSSVDSALSSQIVQQQSALAQEVASVTRNQARNGGNVKVPSFANAGGAGIVTVQGIQVASSIAANLNALLNAARADGIVMSGGGYRDPAQQIALRKAHCGSSNYEIYDAPASSCSPPTAQPGMSMHERGLAVDFTVGGQTITRGSAAFAWLSAHAASYGFYNLPSEPWHWSVNGD